MAVCDTCGNDFDQSFEVLTASGSRYVFDSVECAAAQIAPTCIACGVRILGHGVRNEEHTYCCAGCAREAGVVGLVDSVTSGS